MKVCSVCEEIVSEGQGCGRSDCPHHFIVSDANDSLLGMTGKADNALQVGLDRIDNDARNIVRKIAFAVGVIGIIAVSWSVIDSDHSDVETNNIAAERNGGLRVVPRSVESETIQSAASWVCTGVLAEPFTVNLSEKTYSFASVNPDEGALKGVLKEGRPEKYDDGTIMTPLSLIGSGAPKGRWAYLQSPGKRKALMSYAIETSGDANECTPPGASAEYVLN